jgi:AcrR family transcriptional regulator
MPATRTPELDTKQRLLDAAERLFAQHGFHPTSLRAITAAAGANLAAVNYHFRSKEGLMAAVIDRRLGPLNAERLRRLEAVLEGAARDGRPPSSRALLQSFMEPSLRFRQGGEEHRHFIALIGRVVNEADEGIRRLFFQRMQPVFERLLPALRQALPGVDGEVLFWRLHFAIGAMAHTMFMADKRPPLPGQVDPEVDADRLLALLLPFVTAGMEAP